MAPDGRSLFHRLLFRRDWPHFVAFDVLSIDGADVRDRPLLERKPQPVSNRSPHHGAVRVGGLLPEQDQALISGVKKALERA